ncbi:XisI protein [Alkalinema sp. FACHB-956]|uniref:XisI protein n=1 Tax=Alkalinema sp. FACHB-956 TaxID=2692768 RepID=UPI0016875477|nr:XisI protein [Alkalinema sp. FACHB-956]MBD2327599.1 XisI protein [Alkalinema sp. FACHB-956]
MVTQSRKVAALKSEENQQSRLEVYRQVIQTLLTDYAARSSTEAVQCIPLMDGQGDHYQVLDIGWDESGKRIFKPVLHIDIIDNKIWIQENITDLDLDTLLATAGIQPSEIVIGFHSPSLRKFGIYAIE